jgi:hypothetical protein
MIASVKLTDRRERKKLETPGSKIVYHASIERRAPDIVAVARSTAQLVECEQRGAMRDDDWLNVYKELLTSIRTTDEISFRLLGFVPTVAGITAGALTLLETSELLQTATSGVVVALSIIGFLITFGLFRWELRNAQQCRWFIESAEQFEKYALHKDHPDPLTATPEPSLTRLQYLGWSGQPRPKFPKLPWPWLRARSEHSAVPVTSSQPQPACANCQPNDAAQKPGWGKTEAEGAVYCAAMAAWLVPAVVGFSSLLSD